MNILSTLIPTLLSLRDHISKFLFFDNTNKILQHD
jgi:hypothetical protein